MQTVVLGLRKEDKVGELEVVEEEEVVEVEVGGRRTLYQGAAAVDDMRRRSRMEPMEKRSLRWSRTYRRRFRNNRKLRR